MKKRLVRFVFVSGHEMTLDYTNDEKFEKLLHAFTHSWESAVSTGQKYGFSFRHVMYYEVTEECTD